MNVISKIKMDITKRDSTLSISVVQGDAYTRSLSLELYNGIIPWNIPEGISSAIRYIKPDKTKGYYDTLPDGSSAWSAEKNILTIRLAPQMLTTAGNVKLQIELIKGTHILSTFCLTVYVEPNPAAGVLKSENYINWLQWIQEQSAEHTQLVQQSAQTASLASLAASESAEHASISCDQADSAAALAAESSASAASLLEETASIAANVSAIVAGNEAYTKQESDRRYIPVIVQTADGDSITISDSAAAPFEGLRILGKSTQDHTPAPNDPSALISAGKNGDISFVIKASENDMNPQTISISTENGLHGIPVSSGGNYIDMTGQQWICDEVDFGRGVYIQRVLYVVFDGSDDEGWAMAATSVSSIYRAVTQNYHNIIAGSMESYKVSNGLCSHYPTIPAGTVGTWGGNLGFSVGSSGQIYVFDPMYSGSTSAQWKNFLKGNPITCLFQLITPVEIPLAEKELAAYASLHTNYPTTIVTNDSGAFIKAKYAVDLKNYIDSRIRSLCSV